MNLEVHVIPVSDVERSKQFYQQLGWRLVGALVVSDIKGCARGSYPP